MSKVRAERPNFLKIALMVLAIAFSTWIVMSAALEKGISGNSRFLLLFICIGSGLLMWALTPNLPRNWNPSEWKKSKAIPSVLSVLFQTLLVVAALVQLLAPRPAVESESLKIEKTALATLKLTEALFSQSNQNAASSALKKLPGLWGETEKCEVAYRMKVENELLLIIGERRPANSPPFALKAKIQPFDPKTPDVVSATAIGPVAADGRRSVAVASFTYSTNGSSEQLVWADAENPATLTLFRCEETT